MTEITDEEKLALLGFDNLKHSFAWYRERYEELPSILEIFIVDILNRCGVFPANTKNNEKRLSYQNYYLVIERDQENFLLKINNTDRGEVLKEQKLKDANQAARQLIKESYTESGAISQYWKV